MKEFFLHKNANVPNESRVVSELPANILMGSESSYFLGREGE